MRGNAKLAFLLGMCAGIVFLIVVRGKLKEGRPPGSRSSVGVGVSPRQTGTPGEKPSGRPRNPRANPRRPIDNSDNDDWRVTSKVKLDDDVSPTPPVREKPKREPIVGWRPYDPAAYDNEEEDKKEKQEDEDYPEPPKEEDHITSATRYEYFLLTHFNLGFHDIPSSYYLTVVLSTRQPRRWNMSEDEWYSLRDRIMAVSRGGSRHQCAHMWPVYIRGENRTEIWMLFKIPNRAKIKGILIDKKSLPIPEVVDSGE